MALARNRPAWNDAIGMRYHGLVQVTEGATGRVDLAVQSTA
jgi:hypothetical protein